MTSGSLIAFLGVAILVTVTPGQDMALVLNNMLLADRRAGFVISAGIVSGLIIWASVGLTALLLSSKPLFTALKFGGAIYLAYLGFQSLRSALQRHDDGLEQTARSDAANENTVNDWSAYRQGILSNLSNPKVAIFYSSLLPQFAGDRAAFELLLSMGLLHGLLALDRASAFMRRTRVRRAIETPTGTVLVGLALRLATGRR